MRNITTIAVIFTAGFAMPACADMHGHHERHGHMKEYMQQRIQEMDTDNDGNADGRIAPEEMRHYRAEHIRDHSTSSE